MFRSFRILRIAFCGLLILGSCTDEPELFLELNLKSSGIEFQNIVTPHDDFNIIDYLYFYNGGGVSIGDINNDELPDIFFTSNQGKNKLYLNRGNLKFEDISRAAGVEGNNSWDTGSSMADVNGDGLLDIYVCAVVGFKGLSGHNELFINQGDNTFIESSEEYNLNFESYSSSTTFFDFDLDGDLDLYLLNMAIHSPHSFGHASLRLNRDEQSGDKLLRNDNNVFVDISEQANIYGGSNGYGLGVVTADFNVDGWPDLYVANDFHEDDFFYINNGNGTFKEMGRSLFTQFSRFSMGCDASDINHDGKPDLITLDMLPPDEVTLKRSDGDENFNVQRLKTGNYGYYYQYARNMLHLNQGQKFIETALMCNVSATDWSWSALWSDFDQDSHQDLFITNGIPKRPNDLDYIKYVSGENVSSAIGSSKLIDQKALSLMPDGSAQNFVFKGDGHFSFQDKSSDWLPEKKTCSTAASIGDLDGDGDLDIVVNNVNGAPQIYVNQTNGKSHYLKLKLQFEGKNPNAIGSKVYAYTNGQLQVKELYLTRGFQASSEPLIHFGFGDSKVVDSLIIVWPNRKIEKFNDLQINKSLRISYGTESLSSLGIISQNTLGYRFNQISPDSLGISYKHYEDTYSDFSRVKLLPYQQSDRGPAASVGDLNNDGKDDIFFGGSKYVPAKIFLQSNNQFKETKFPEIENDSIKEDVDAMIADFNKDGFQDLFVASGGADFFGKSNALLDTYYFGGKNMFKSKVVAGVYEHASCVLAFDIENDGDLDVFVGNQSVSGNFGSIPNSTLLINENGNLSSKQEDVFGQIGMVTSAAFADLNGDSYQDLIIVGEWMAPKFLINSKGKFKVEEKLKQELNGLWQSVTAADLDKDGDFDLVLGNWGLNSKYKASKRAPLKMFYSDFDKNGIKETIVALEKDGKYFPTETLDILASQIPGLRKKFQSYEGFAGKSVDELFGSQILKNATVFHVNTLASGFLINEGRSFVFQPFSNEFQIAPIMAQLKYDLDKDGFEEVILAGNYFGVQPYHGRFASFPGALVEDSFKLEWGLNIGLDFINISVRQLNILKVNDQNFLLVTSNNEKVQLYKIK